MPAAVWKNLQCLQSIDGEIVLAFFKRVPERLGKDLPCICPGKTI